MRPNKKIMFSQSESGTSKPLLSSQTWSLLNWFT